MAYYAKDSAGRYRIPPERQRPVFLIGAPGIGKTAIMEQIAQELHVGLVSYSMTHHTRQSALGLPKIQTMTYEDTEFQISQYTMSEIIASIYQLMERTGLKEGILFLDEINCVSETLAPSMLLFLQYKMFGGHRIPDGWVIVTAGNPPEYNKSVREFDVVTMDRLKKITVEPDYSIWKEYACRQNIHPSIITYLDIKKDHFYHMETTLDGKRFVTPRGWEDLSQMLCSFELLSLPVSEKLISQYIQDNRIAKDFAAYYDLFAKYQSDYQIDEILSGNVSPEIRERASRAKFDEKVALLGLFLNKLAAETMEHAITRKTLSKVLKLLKSVKTDGSDVLTCCLKETKEQLLSARQDRTLSREDIQILTDFQDIVSGYEHMLQSGQDFSALKSDLSGKMKLFQAQTALIHQHFDHLLTFYEDVFSSGQEMLLLITELTVNEYTSSFISQYGCEKYFAHNKELLFHERNKEILAQFEELGL